MISASLPCCLQANCQEVWHIYGAALMLVRVGEKHLMCDKIQILFFLKKKTSAQGMIWLHASYVTATFILPVISPPPSFCCQAMREII